MSTCTQLQEWTTQWFSGQDICHGFSVFACALGGLDAYHEQTVQWRRGRTICVFYPLPTDLVANVGSFCPAHYTSCVALGCDRYDGVNLLEMAETIAGRLHGLSCSPSCGLFTVSFQSCPWTEVSAVSLRRWVPLNLSFSP
jgi:hypothetical protein